MAQTTNNLRKILKACWFTPGFDGRWGLPLLLVGDPGTGKTSGDRKSTRLNSSHSQQSRMPSSA